MFPKFIIGHCKNIEIKKKKSIYVVFTDELQNNNNYFFIFLNNWTKNTVHIFLFESYSKHDNYNKNYCLTFLIYFFLQTNTVHEKSYNKYCIHIFF